MGSSFDDHCGLNYKGGPVCPPKRKCRTVAVTGATEFDDGVDTGRYRTQVRPDEQTGRSDCEQDDDKDDDQ